MKNLLKTIALAICISACYGCSVEPIENSNPETSIEENAEFSSCVNQDPEVRLTNNGTVAVDLEVINSDDDTVVYVTNLLPGEASSWLSFASGEVLFSISNDQVQDIKVVYTMNLCMIFDMEVDSNNELTSATPQQL